MPKLLSTAYFPPVSYFAAMAQDMGGLRPACAKAQAHVRGEATPECAQKPAFEPHSIVPSVVYIESCENYCKQSYRNRCLFYAADGVQSLSFPIVHEGGSHRHPISEIKVDYSVPWVMKHKRAIVSAYRTSAYFEYYQDELFAILDSRPERLLDLNMEILRFFIRNTGLEVDLRLTQEYFHDAILRDDSGVPVICDDFRESIHPKKENTILASLGLEKPYFQVFSQKYGFKSDLSIMDLLFNEGPDSILFLKKL